MSHTDLFLTLYLRPKVYAEVIIRGRLPVVRALCCLLRDGEWFTLWGQGAQGRPGAGCPTYLAARRKHCPQGKKRAWKWAGLRLREGNKNAPPGGGLGVGSPAMPVPARLGLPILPRDRAVLGGWRRLGIPLAAWGRRKPRSSSISNPSEAPLRAPAVSGVGRGTQHPPWGSEPLSLKLLGFLWWEGGGLSSARSPAPEGFCVRIAHLYPHPEQHGQPCCARWKTPEVPAMLLWWLSLPGPWHYPRMWFVPHGLGTCSSPICPMGWTHPFPPFSVTFLSFLVSSSSSSLLRNTTGSLSFPEESPHFICFPEADWDFSSACVICSD